MESMISTSHYINTSNKGLNYSTSDDDQLSSWDLYNEDDSLFPFSASENSSECDDNNKGIFGRFSVNKRRKIKVAVVDEELEDTASSPDHTPKANNFSHLMYMNYSKAMEMIMATTPTAPFFQDKGDSNGKGSNEDDTHELRKKGLCLVPLSLLFDNYI